MGLLGWEIFMVTNKYVCIVVCGQRWLVPALRALLPLLLLLCFAVCGQRWLVAALRICCLCLCFLVAVYGACQSNSALFLRLLHPSLLETIAALAYIHAYPWCCVAPLRYTHSLRQCCIYFAAFALRECDSLVIRVHVQFGHGVWPPPQQR